MSVLNAARGGGGGGGIMPPPPPSDLGRRKILQEHQAGCTLEDSMVRFFQKLHFLFLIN